jgi:hypothetical protein
MFSVKRSVLPKEALLSRYATSGGFTDCYAVDIFENASQADFISAFYTTWAFKTERFILKWVVSRPSTDLEAKALSNGTRQTFAAWRVEDQSENQILLCDDQGRTRSWLMTEQMDGEAGPYTRLYFGTAIVSTKRSEPSRPSIGPWFKALMVFHKVYSQVLLATAKRRLASG